jgi:hypothetical protein
MAPKFGKKVYLCLAPNRQHYWLLTKFVHHQRGGMVTHQSNPAVGYVNDDLRRITTLQDEHVLGSWKEIAAYLGKGVRTVQRYERELGLPIRRPNDQRQIVFAYPSELRSWLDRFKSRSVLPSR